MQAARLLSRGGEAAIPATAHCLMIDGVLAMRGVRLPVAAPSSSRLSGPSRSDDRLFSGAIDSY